jgi:parallel beta-helix repeat protein
MSSFSQRFRRHWRRSNGRVRRTPRPRLSGVEPLEARALLAVSAAYVDDFSSIPPAVRGTGGAWTNTNTDMGAVVVTIDGTDSVQDVYMRVRNGSYQFATDVSFVSTFFSIQTNFANTYQLQNTDPNFSVDPPTAPTFGSYTSNFRSILVQGDGLVDGVDAPSFTIIGASQTVDKALVVSLTADDGSALSNSLISIGAPVSVSAAAAAGEIGYRVSTPTGGLLEGGQVYLEAESVAVSAAVTSQNDVTILSQIGDENQVQDVVSAGIDINQTVRGNGDFFISADGTAFNVNAGGSLSGVGPVATSPAANFTLDLRDADAQIAGTINASQQDIWLSPSALGLAAEARTITTVSSSTGVQSGRLIGDDLIVYLANIGGSVVSPTLPRDGTVDIQTSIDTLRITSSATTVADALDYDITVTNDRSLLLDAVMASRGDMAYATTAGTIDLRAAIDTLGSFALESAADLVLDSEIRSAGSVALESSAGSVTTRAAVVTQEASTELGEITITAAQNVRLESLVQAEYDGIVVTAGAGSIQSQDPSDPTSRLVGSSATLTAATGISVGTRVESITAAVTGAGDLLIEDDSDDREDPAVEPPFGILALESLRTASGSIDVTAIQNIDAAFLIATGGDVSLASTEGDIDIVSLSAADGAAVLSAPGWADETGFYETGYIFGDEFSVTAGEIDWTARFAPEVDMYRNIPIISARLLGEGPIEFEADGSVTLKEVITSDGSITITSNGGSIEAGRVEAVLGDFASEADVSLAADGDITFTSFVNRAGATVSGVVALLGDVTATAGQSLLDDGDAATIGITSDAITLQAAGNGVGGQIGSPDARVSVAASSPSGFATVFAESGSFLPVTGIYLEGQTAITATAAAAEVVDIRTVGAVSDLDVGSVTVSDLFGQIALSGGRDLLVGSAVVAGGDFLEGSEISLTAARNIRNANDDPGQTDLLADGLRLSAPSLDGTFDLSAADAINRLSAAATRTGGVVNLPFDREDPLTLDGITSVRGGISITNTDIGDLLVAGDGIRAGTAATGNQVVLTTAGGIGLPIDSAEAGVITAGGTVSLNAGADVVARTAAGTLAASSTEGVIEIEQTGNVRLSNIVTDVLSAVTLAVEGTILPGSGTITTGTASVTATTGMTINTDVTTLSALAEAGNLTVIEASGLEVGPESIRAPGGTASITVREGTLNGSGEKIEAAAVILRLLEAGNAIDVETSTSSLQASTAGGPISIQNDQAFTIGTGGIVAGSAAAGYSDIALTSTAGGITGGVGSGLIQGDGLVLTVPGAITVRTSVHSIDSASNRSGNIAITQTGKSLVLDNVLAASGGITVTNNDNISVGTVEAVGTRRNVSITATGRNKSITLGPESILALDDTITLEATGGIDGTSQGEIVGDIKAGAAVLSASGDVTATLEVGRVEASATGTDPGTGQPSNLDITVLGTQPLFIGTGGNNSGSLYAAGSLSLTVFNSEDPDNLGVDIIVGALPESGIDDVSLNTRGNVTFAIVNSAAQGPGSLTGAIADAESVVNTLGGTRGVSFSTSIRSPIRLTDTIEFSSPLALNGSSRIDVQTGRIITGRPVDIDGARLPVGESGFRILGAADGSRITGLAFSEFRIGTSAVELRGTAADPVSDAIIDGNSFGVTSTGRALGNGIGISATFAENASIRDNVFGLSREAGIVLGEGVTGSTVAANYVGTDTRGRNLSNLVGVSLDGAGAGNVVGGVAAADANQIRFNTIGVQVSDTNASAGVATAIRGNDFQQNATALRIDGVSKGVDVVANSMIRGTGDAIVVADSVAGVSIEGNRIGTNAASQLGLGNAGSGVRVSASGTGIQVVGNTIFGNGEGVSLEGTAAGTLIESNAITANAGAGVVASASARGIVRKNSILSNDGTGVIARDGATLVVGSPASEPSAAVIRANANTIHSNGGYGVEVLAAAFAQIAGNSLASNTLGSVVNENLSAPVITSAAIVSSSSVGTLRVALAGLVAGQVIDLYAGGESASRTYLGRVVATGATAVFIMSRDEQVAAGVAAEVYVGAPITASRISTGPSGQTSTFAAKATLQRA